MGPSRREHKNIVIIFLLFSGVCIAQDQIDRKDVPVPSPAHPECFATCPAIARKSDGRKQNVSKDQSAGLDLDALASDQQVHDIFANKKTEKERFDFYRDYVAKYYPKALVIRDYYFANMTPDEVLKAIKIIIDVISERTWFYFSDKPETFVCGYYWEIIIDQLNVLHEFLCKARINQVNQKIFIPAQDEASYCSNLVSDSLEAVDDGSVAFLDNVSQPWQKAILYEFYVLSFDFLRKMFNEGILFNDPLKAFSYLSELEYVVERLEGSAYEAEYKEHLATCHQLVDLLKTRLENS